MVDDRYLYVTDDHARVTHAEGWLGWLPAEQNEDRRNTEAQRDAGKPDRERNDDGGQVHAAIDVRHANGTSRRPSGRSVVARHDGQRSPRSIFKETKPSARGAE
ncbi:hypothetical protein GCM10009804_35990 [Kribbella hippodromi]|uniref:Uncharacterized protein n=1 Tax=Kribbella hippodromi TaxID=434347 RepID=A0ABN2DEL7_9ACTN